MQCRMWSIIYCISVECSIIISLLGKEIQHHPTTIVVILAGEQLIKFRFVDINVVREMPILYQDGIYGHYPWAPSPIMSNIRVKELSFTSPSMWQWSFLLLFMLSCAKLHTVENAIVMANKSFVGFILLGFITFIPIRRMSCLLVTMSTDLFSFLRFNI